MTTSEPATITAPGIEEAVRKKLQDAPNPLKLSEIVKGLPKPKKSKKAPPPPDLNEEARKLLEEEVRLGRAFSYPSGKKDEVRYWIKDEKQVLREKALVHGSTPLTLSALKTKLGKEVKGADGVFVEAIIREMISDDKLFEHPPKTKAGSPLFGASSPPPPPPPVPPLEQTKHRKAVTNLVNACKKLLAAAVVPAEELLQLLRTHLGTSDSAERGHPAPSELTTLAPTLIAPAGAPPALPGTALDELILKAVSNAPVLSLAELRREMPREHQGQTFDEAVLRLADCQRVVISQDADPSSFSESQRAEFVRDGSDLFTTIMKRN